MKNTEYTNRDFILELLAGLVIVILIFAGLFSIPKKERPTPEQWEEYLKAVNPPVSREYEDCDCLREDCDICAEYLMFELQDHMWRDNQAKR